MVAIGRRWVKDRLADMLQKVLSWQRGIAQAGQVTGLLLAVDPLDIMLK